MDKDSILINYMNSINLGQNTQLGRLIILDIVDKGRKTGRRDIDIADVRSAGEHTLEYADPCAKMKILYLPEKFCYNE